MAAGWEQEITELLQEAQDIAVRFDIEQDLTSTQESKARNNIGITTTANNISCDDYKIIFGY
jgi:hypothetical protein